MWAAALLHQGQEVGSGNGVALDGRVQLHQRAQMPPLRRHRSRRGPSLRREHGTARVLRGGARPRRCAEEAARPWRVDGRTAVVLEVAERGYGALGGVCGNGGGGGSASGTRPKGNAEPGIDVGEGNAESGHGKTSCGAIAANTLAASSRRVASGMRSRSACCPNEAFTTAAAKTSSGRSGSPAKLGGGGSSANGQSWGAVQGRGAAVVGG
eukprot:CAMPEP_0176022988 /NCGR_PEP_ID=MMETSP0120_2-20121206/11205_1 /TAXON_ID=160619 /ORGANISM="Kryptoperidinium foliaceum, Strain CCMP 1326" /LENGTH=210 /DNA_ID=CAMNT_0017356143 /DNA_START=515 /DNA_END=1145 /DNA_ORIENTATION=+